MPQQRTGTIVLGIITSMLILGAVPQLRAQGTPAAYSTMAPIDRYLMPDRGAEVALARSAAPAAVADSASVLVLGRRGYETAITGTNGFVCVVERAWMSAFDDPGFWNPKNRGPVCYNPPAARSVLPFTLKRTALILAGLSKAATKDSIKGGLDRGEFPALQPGGMAYMLSKGAYLTDAGSHNLAHLMFFAPVMDGAGWGADLPNSPVARLPQFLGAPEPITVFIVAVGHWSDGTAAPQM